MQVEFGSGSRVGLPGLASMSTDDALEVVILGHGWSSLRLPRPSRKAGRTPDHSDPGESSPLRLNGGSAGAATKAQRRVTLRCRIPDSPGILQPALIRMCRAGHPCTGHLCGPGPAPDTGHPRLSRPGCEDFLYSVKGGAFGAASRSPPGLRPRRPAPTSGIALGRGRQDAVQPATRRRRPEAQALRAIGSMRPANGRTADEGGRGGQLGWSFRSPRSGCQGPRLLVGEPGGSPLLGAPVRPGRVGAWRSSPHAGRALPDGPPRLPRTDSRSPQSVLSSSTEAVNCRELARPVSARQRPFLASTPGQPDPPRNSCSTTTSRQTPVNNGLLGCTRRA